MVELIKLYDFHQNATKNFEENKNTIDRSGCKFEEHLRVQGTTTGKSLPMKYRFGHK